MRETRSSGILIIARTWVVGIGLLVALQMFMQWQLDLGVSLTPYEIAGIAGLFIVAFIWASVQPSRPASKRKPIAEDTSHWHFGRNAPLLAFGVLVLLVTLALLSIVLPELDPVIDTTISRFLSVPLALVGIGGLILDKRQDRRRQASALNDDAGAL